MLVVADDGISEYARVVALLPEAGLNALEAGVALHAVFEGIPFVEHAVEFVEGAVVAVADAVEEGDLVVGGGVGRVGRDEVGPFLVVEEEGKFGFDRVGVVEDFW